MQNSDGIDFVSRFPDGLRFCGAFAIDRNIECMVDRMINLSKWRERQTTFILYVSHIMEVVDSIVGGCFLFPTTSSCVFRSQSVMRGFKTTGCFLKNGFSNKNSIQKTRRMTNGSIHKWKTFVSCAIGCCTTIVKLTFWIVQAHISTSNEHVTGQTREIVEG